MDWSFHSSLCGYHIMVCSKRYNVVGEFLNCRQEIDDKEDRHTVDGYWPDLENVVVGYVPCIPILCI